MAKKAINIPQTVSYLSYQFAKSAAAASHVIGDKALRYRDKKGKVVTTPLYDYQVKFSYLVDDIERGPQYIVPKRISEANQLINTLEGLSQKEG